MLNIFKRVGFYLSVSLLLSFFVSVSVAFADSCVWNGTTSTWSDSGNWTSCGGSIPDSADTVTFNTTSTQSVTADTNVSASVFTVSSGYTGIIDFNSYDLNVYSLTLSDGTFKAPGIGKTLSLAQNFTVEAGAAYVDQSGTVAFNVFSASSQTMNVDSSLSITNLTLSLTGSPAQNYLYFGSSDTVTVTGTLTLTDGFFQGASGAKIVSTGSVSVGTGFDGGTGQIDFTGSTNFNLPSGGTSLPVITVNNASLEIGTAGAGTFNFDSTLTLDAGTISNAGGGNFSIAGDYTQNGGSFFAGSATTLTFSGRGDLDGGTFDGETAATIAFGDSLDVNGATVDMSGLTTLDLNGGVSFNMDSGSFSAPGSGGTMYVLTTFDVETGGIFTSSDGIIEFDGFYPGSRSMNVNGSLTVENLTLNMLGVPTQNYLYISSGDTINVTGTLTLSDGFLQTSGGGSKIVAASTSTVVVENGFEGGGGQLDILSNNDFDLPSGGAALPSVLVNSASLDIDTAGTGTFSFNSLDLAVGNIDNTGAGTWSIATTFDQSGSTTFDVGSGGFSVGGNYSLTDTATFNAGSSSSVSFGDRGDIDGGTFNGQTVTTISFGDTLDIAGGVFDAIGLTTLDLNGSSISFNMTTGSLSAPTTLKVADDLIITGGVFTHNSGTVVFDTFVPAISYFNVAGIAFNNLEINVSGDGGQDDVTLQSALDLDGDLTIIDGDFFAGGNTVNIAGNWDRQSIGTFTHGNNEVIFDGDAVAQSIDGSNTFYQLTRQTAGTWEFEAGTTQTVTNTWTAEGTGTQTGALLLRSSVADSEWFIDPQSTRTLNYIDVKDSNNSNASEIVVSGQFANDSSGNTNWNFTGATPFLAAVPIPEFSVYLLMLTLLIGMGFVQSEFRLFAKDSVLK